MTAGQHCERVTVTLTPEASAALAALCGPGRTKTDAVNRALRSVRLPRGADRRRAPRCSSGSRTALPPRSGSSNPGMPVPGDACRSISRLRSVRRVEGITLAAIAAAHPGMHIYRVARRRAGRVDPGRARQPHRFADVRRRRGRAGRGAGRQAERLGDGAERVAAAAAARPRAVLRRCPRAIASTGRPRRRNRPGGPPCRARAAPRWPARPGPSRARVVTARGEVRGHRAPRRPARRPSSSGGRSPHPGARGTGRVAVRGFGHLCSLPGHARPGVTVRSAPRQARLTLRQSFIIRA